MLSSYLNSMGMAVRLIVIFYFPMSVVGEELENTQSTAKEITDNSQLEHILVTVNRQTQTLQEISGAVSVLGEEELERQSIIDITGLDNAVPGLKVGMSGGEIRPAMRGARTNEVGVAGSGIAEQVIGIFIDGIYVPTTTAGTSAYIDLNRIEVLRGPQGTLYGRNTFAGSINVITNQPELSESYGSVKVLAGNYNRRRFEGIFNLPITDKLATRLVMAADQHDGLINNHYLAGSSDDLREKNTFYGRLNTKFQPNDDFSMLFKVDYSEKDANSEAIWGYQQTYGYKVIEMQDGSGRFIPQAIVEPGHIYQPENAQHQDTGPYDVYRNAISFDRQEQLSATIELALHTELLDFKWTTNFSKLKGQQFYDNDYSDGGLDNVGGFGRKDEHQTWSSELQIVSVQTAPLSWVAGLYFYGQQADWAWLWRADTNNDGIADKITVPSWGNPQYDPHTLQSAAMYGQFQYQINAKTNFSAGLRFSKDDKAFTGDDIPDWEHSQLSWKAALAYKLNKDQMYYLNISTGYRTGGANDNRVVARGASPLYGNEEVISYEVGLKQYVLDATMRMNAAIFVNEYSDVKAQLFAVACNDINLTQSVIDCVVAGESTTFEYYENGGDVTAKGLELEFSWIPYDDTKIVAQYTWLKAQFSDDYKVGNSALQPLLGLGNLQNRQDINDKNSQFSFAGWQPAMSPEHSIGLSVYYDFNLSSGDLITPYLKLNYLDDYYAFDVNIPETQVASHWMLDANITWQIDDLTLALFVKNVTNETVLTRAVVHSQIVNGLPANSIQANWNNPRTLGLTIKYAY